MITGAKPHGVWFTSVFLHWGTAITAEIDIAIPLYKQSLTRMNFCPWKQSGHGFTHLVCSPLNSTHVSNCSWQGHNRVYPCGLEKLLCFSCRAICLPPPPISTGNCLVCPRSSHITVAHWGNDNNSSAWIWMSSFSLPVDFVAWLMLLCLAWRQWLRGQDEQSCDCTRCKYTLAICFKVEQRERGDEGGAGKAEENEIKTPVAALLIASSRAKN